MPRLIIILMACFLLSACSQHVNPSWEDGNLSKREHMRRRLERLESQENNKTGEVLRKIAEPGW